MSHSVVGACELTVPVSTPPAVPPPSVPVPTSSSTAPRRSSRARIPTPAGQSYADELAASKAHLMALRHNRADRAAENSLREGVVAVENLEGLPEDITDVEPNTDVSEVMANACIEEHAHDLGPIMKFLGIQFERSRSTHQLWMHGLVFTQLPCFHVFVRSSWTHTSRLTFSSSS
ncbi:hypothetical protein EV424DRAFT_1448606 [Suillus variegatus]|nr:hypothetical protein EV424DRAFT_1448606 [Suillus variegatus]